MPRATNENRDQGSGDRVTEGGAFAVAEVAIETLISEIQRYLDVVEVFRAEGCEPRWA